MSEPKRVTLDVRPALARGEEPFAAIMQAVQPLTSPGDQLILIAPFTPEPLFGVLNGQGYDHEVVAKGDGSFEVTFTRR